MERRRLRMPPGEAVTRASPAELQRRDKGQMASCLRRTQATVIVIIHWQVLEIPLEVF